MNTSIHKKQRFASSNASEFLPVLRERVNEYFTTNNISKNGDSNMIIKTIFMFSLYLVPYFFILFANISNPYLFLGLWMLMGLGGAGIGLNIMHDANHGSYSSNGRINKFLSYSMNLIGGNAEIWKLQHNVLHHTYTNIEGSDDDIDTPPFLRFSPHKKRYGIHKFQFIYTWFFYGISTLSWVTAKEFGQLQKYDKLGLFRKEKQKNIILMQLIAWKLVYYGYAVVLPYVFTDFSLGFILLCFLSMHFVSGLTLSMIFQTAHVMPECEFPVPNENGMLKSSWVEHEMLTTSNFAPKSKALTWLVGSLNYQVEHHLFPQICHIHYHKIAPIVEQTAKEFGVPYNSRRTFISALYHHARMLYILGRVETSLSKAA